MVCRGWAIGSIFAFFLLGNYLRYVGRRQWCLGDVATTFSLPSCWLFWGRVRWGGLRGSGVEL